METVMNAAMVEQPQSSSGRDTEYAPIDRSCGAADDESAGDLLITCFPICIAKGRVGKKTKRKK